MKVHFCFHFIYYILLTQNYVQPHAICTNSHDLKCVITVHHARKNVLFSLIM